VDNIFSESRQLKYEVKLNYDDYMSISQDFYTYSLNEETIRIMEGYGFT